MPIPLALLDLYLVLLSDRPSHLWRDDSWWASCRGPLWGQLPTVAVCAFTILPALLAAWLLWMPWQVRVRFMVRVRVWVRVSVSV